MSTAPVVETQASPLRLRRPGLAMPWLTAAVLALITLLGAGLRFWRIGHQSFWYDESLTLLVVHHTFGQVPSLLRHSQGVPPLYFYLAWIWSHIFGYSEAGVRSLSAVIGVATVPVIYLTGRRLLSARAGLIAAVLTACNPLLVWYSQEAREYSLLGLLAALSLLAFAHLLAPRPARRWLVIWALSAMLALATHYFAVLIVVPEAIWLLWIHRRAAPVWFAVFAVGVAGALLAWFATGQKGNDAAWITEAPLSLRLGQIAPQFLLGMGSPARAWLKAAGLVAILLALIALLARADVRERLGAARVGGLAVGSFSLSLLLAVGGVDRIITRNLLVVLLALILLVAGGLAVRRARVLGLAGTAILCAVGITAAIAVAVDETYQRPPWRQVASVIGSGRPAGAASAIVFEDSDSTLPLADYVPRMQGLFFTASIEELDVVAAVKAPTVPFCWWGATCSLPVAPLDTSLHIPGFSAAGPVIHVDQFSIYRLRAAKPVVVTRAQIAHALSSAHLTSYGLFVEPAG